MTVVISASDVDINLIACSFHGPAKAGHYVGSEVPVLFRQLGTR
jgi:hypothetical protein